MIAPATIPLRRRDGSIAAYALVDAEDHERLAQYRWCLDGAYAARWDGEGQPLARMHRDVLGLECGDGLEGDHINLVKLDNRRSNLRVVTHAQQMQNLPPQKGRTSRHRGVSLFRTGRWRAHCQLHGKQHHLGYFLHEEDAASAVRAFRAEHMPFSTEMKVPA